MPRWGRISWGSRDSREGSGCQEMRMERLPDPCFSNSRPQPPCCQFNRSGPAFSSLMKWNTMLLSVARWRTTSRTFCFAVKMKHRGSWLKRCVLIYGRRRVKMSTWLEENVVMRSFHAIIYKMPSERSDWIMGEERGPKKRSVFRLFCLMFHWHLQHGPPRPQVSA